MNKNKYLEQLSQQLRHLPQEDRLDAIQYYTEYLEEMGIDEETDVVAILGTPKEVARDIIGNCTEKHLEKHKEKAGVKSSATLIWLIILGICASPIAIPLLVAALIVVIVLVVAGVILIGSLIFVGVAVALAGIVCLVISFVTLGFFNKLECIGLGLICISLGALFVFGIIKLSQVCVRGIAHIMCAK